MTAPMVNAPPVRLDGQTAIVTGAGRGLGRAYAIALAAAGAHVVITARSEAELGSTAAVIKGAGGSSAAFPADVTDAAAVARIVEAVGQVDILVNNAGMNRALGRIGEVEPEEWWRELEVNFRGPLLFAQAVLPGMRKRKGGRIVNIASAAGLQAFEGSSAYDVSKTALIRLSESIAVEGRGDNIACFAIHPGAVPTAMGAHVLASADIRQRAPAFCALLEGLFSSGRASPIEASVELVLLLVSGAADALSGCYLSVGDDMPALLDDAAAIQQAERRKLRLRD
jgi:NAD(P)-dependent dehydrogenase (short-subunit alcohol dehydrogenase family)